MMEKAWRKKILVLVCLLVELENEVTLVFNVPRE